MIYPSQAIQIRPDLIEYRELCSKFGYQPSKEEYEETLKFLLLFHTGIGHTCESSEVDFFYENMEMHLLENNVDQSLFELIDSLTVSNAQYPLHPLRAATPPCSKYRTMHAFPYHDSP